MIKWNWQLPDWPHFYWDKALISNKEDDFRLATGVLTGATIHLQKNDLDQLVVELLGQEALTTSEIEGELLNRLSVQSSLQAQLDAGPELRATRLHLRFLRVLNFITINSNS